MATDEEQLVLSISADTRQILRAMKRLESDIAKSSAGIVKQFEPIGRAIDKAMPTEIQNRINKMVGIQSEATKEWTGLLVEQSKEMDRLRAKFSPMFATVNSYKSSINEIRAAHRLGAISADEMAAAIQRERQSALASIAAIKGRNAALADTPVAMGLGKGANSFNTANIAAQFQDIAVMAQMGIANPMTIALQQGTQLAAVFNQMGGTRDVIRGIGAAFMQIVNPVSLVTVGTIAAGVAAYNYFSESKEGAEATEKVLKQQADLIQSIAQKWGEATPAIRAYANEQDRIAGRANAEAAANLRAAETFKAIGREVSSAGDAIQDVQDLLRQSLPADQVVAIQRAFGILSRTAAENKTTVEELDAAHKALMDAFRSKNIPVLKESADAIAELRPRLEEVREQMAVVAAEKNLQLMLEDLQAKIGNISSAKAREELSSLMKQAEKGEVSIRDLLAELARISGYAPDVSGIISAFRAVADAATAARNTADPMWTAKASQGGRTRYGSSGFMALPGSAPTPDRRVDPYFQDWMTKDKSSRAPKRTPDDRFFEDIEAIKQRTIALAEEKAQLGLSYEAQQKRKMAFDLEQKALKDVREAARQKGDQDWQNAQLTPGQIKQIDEVAAAYARQADELRKAQNELAFQRDMLRGALGDLKSALDDGKLEWEEMGQIAINVLDKITNKLLDDVVDAILEVSRVGSGGSGGLLGFLGSLFGGGFRPNTTASAFFTNGFASGTANTGGRRGQPAGVVHGQEAVIPLPDNKKVPVQIQGGASGYVDNRVITIDARGSQQGVGEEIRRALEEYDRGRKARLASDIPDLRRRMGAL